MTQVPTLRKIERAAMRTHKPTQIGLFNFAPR